MFEGYVSEILASRFGKFIEGFDSKSESLRFSALKGELNLTNLTLKTDALRDELDLPIVVRHGQIGTFFLKIP
jgi:hypothetical protein